MIPEGEYLLAHVGFSATEKPFLQVQSSDDINTYKPLGFTGTLSFDMTQRYCVGWHDIATGENAICPTSESIDAKYDQCSACQKRTGFNPAFYNATSVSAQQEQRNLEPHSLYLAHFGGSIVKVGMTHTKRGNRRLLEQGARSAIILDTFASALIARQYEARIASLNGISETIQVKKKIELLSTLYDSIAGEKLLHDTCQRIHDVLQIHFNNTTVQQFDDDYIENHTVTLQPNPFDTSNLHLLSGHMIGMIGSLLISEQQDAQLVLPMKKYTGYRMRVSHEIQPIDLPAQQTALF